MEKDSRILISVVSYEKGWDNGKETIFFLVKVDYNGHENTLKKRFSKFTDLYEKLKTIYDKVPEPPAKTLLKLSKDSDLDKRKQALEKFLKVSPAQPGSRHQKRPLLRQPSFGVLGSAEVHRAHYS